jgi:hypothetical protein
MREYRHAPSTTRRRPRDRFVVRERTQAKRVVDDLAAGRPVPHALLGLRMARLTPEVLGATD